MEKIKGFVSEIRNFGNLSFIIVRNGYNKTQVTLIKKENEELFNIIKKLTKESVIEVVGEKKQSSQAMNGYEIIPSEINILSLSKTPLPIDLSESINTGFDNRINNRFIDLRKEKVRAIFEIRSKFLKATVDFFDNNDFLNINSPKIVSSGVESGAELFKIDYFGKKAYLSQSPQVYKEMMIAAGFNKVYEIGAVFRAEKSNTTRHLTEFTGIDFEVGYIDSEKEVISIIEKYLIYSFNYIKENCKQQLEILGVNLKVPTSLPMITMNELKVFLKEKNKILLEEDDLDPEAEKLCTEISREKFNSDFLVVLEYPFSVRPFYHMCKKENITKSFDIIYNGVEIATGAQREHRLEVLKGQIILKEMNPESLDYYLNMLSYGMPPHGGVGMGLDRIISLMLDLKNVKEGILFPRDPERLTP